MNERQGFYPYEFGIGSQMSRNSFPNTLNVPATINREPSVMLLIHDRTVTPLQKGLHRQAPFLL